jgi:hypothetical protein
MCEAFGTYGGQECSILGFGLGGMMERVYLEDLGVGGKIIWK